MRERIREPEAGRFERRADGFGDRRTTTGSEGEIMKIAGLIQAACATIVLAGSLLLLPAESQAAQTKCTKVWIVWSAIYFESCETLQK